MIFIDGYANLRIEEKLPQSRGNALYIWQEGDYWGYKKYRPLFRDFWGYIQKGLVQLHKCGYITPVVPFYLNEDGRLYQYFGGTPWEDSWDKITKEIYG